MNVNTFRYRGGQKVHLGFSEKPEQIFWPSQYLTFCIEKAKDEEINFKMV